MRLDGVEVKVSLTADQVSAAMRALNLVEIPPWKIFFVEDVTTGLCAAAPLLDDRLIVRARQKTKGRDDVTVKFRPGRRSQLTDSWLATTRTTKGDLDEKFKVEEDWAGDRRVLSISLTAERPEGLVASVAAGERGVATLLTRDQKRLINKCARMRVNPAALTMLPAVSAMRWPNFSVPGPDGVELDVRAERWTFDDMDFLELSIDIDVASASASQAALTQFVKSHALAPANGEPKTTQAMRRLVARAAC